MKAIVSTGETASISAEGGSFSIFRWSGSGPPYAHVHHQDDEAWHVLSGSLRFLLDGEHVQAKAGTTVFVPAGVVHSYAAEPEESTYLVVLTPRLSALIEELHRTNPDGHAEVFKRYDSEIVA